MLQVQSTLVTALTFAAPRVVITLVPADDEMIKAAPSDRFVTIMPVGASFDVGLAAGAGRNAVGNDGQIEVSLYARVMVDRMNQQLTYLTDTTLGVLVDWQKIVNALQLYDPVTIAAPSTDLILEEPMRGLRWQNLPHNAPLHWGRLSSTWETRFLQALS